MVKGIRVDLMRRAYLGTLGRYRLSILYLFSKCDRGSKVG